MTIEKWLGTENKLGKDIWNKKYCYENESFSNWISRITNGSEDLKKLILEKKFLFGGRILANRGLHKLGKNISYSNCYVIPAPQDNMADIMRCAGDMAETYKTGGGCGIHLNNLRPAGAEVNNNAKTSTGPICFMDLYSTVTGVVAQNGRRGALMIAMNVSHPDIEAFIGIKQNLEKVDKANISVMVDDKFMEAVKNDGDYQLYFRTEKGVEFKKTVKAKDIMQKIAFNAWDMGEPGMLFWDRVNNWNLMQGVKEFKLECTNPCLTYDTLVYVADGRGHVPIGVLAEEGKDVDVFCYDKNNKVVIKTMRNPRITGYNEPIYKINIEGGHSIRCTGNHKFMLNDGKYYRADELSNGDSLKLLTKFEASIDNVFNTDSNKKGDYYWLANGFNNNKLEHRIIAEHYTGEKLNNKVVHHKDYNGRNNNINNLLVLSKGEHDDLHKEDMIGDKNPMRRAKNEWSKEKWDLYSKNMSEAVGGENNGRYCGISNEELFEHAKILTVRLGRRLSKREWVKYVKAELGLHHGYSDFREKEFGTIREFAIKASIACGITDFDKNPRSVRHEQNIINQGYKIKYIDNNIFVNRNCEICGEEFWVSYRYREQGICKNKSCTKQHKQILNKKISNNNQNSIEIVDDLINREQCRVFCELKFKHDIPSMEQWIQECSIQGVETCLASSSGFKSWDNLKEKASLYNHRVVSIELDGVEKVYNGTVDEYHNFFVGAFEESTTNNKRKWVYINNLNCGELPLVAEHGKYSGACLLGSINLSEYVKNPFKIDAIFDFKTFIKDVKVCITELDVCLSESQDLHALQIQKDASKYFRSIGLGVMGLSHMCIKLNIAYGSDDFNTLVDKIGFSLADTSIRQSAELAKLYGKAPCLENYKNTVLTKNPFIIKNTTKATMKIVSKYGLRNAQLLTTAPTGSISTMIETSGGIEPLYDCSYTRTTKSLHGKDVEYEVFEKIVEDYKKVHKSVPDWIKDTTAKKLDYNKRIKVQSVWQSHIDNAISSTLNLPETATVDDIVNIYIKSWEQGLKGVTVFRFNCRRVGILNSINEKKTEKPKTETKGNNLVWGDIIKSSDDLIGFKKKLNTGCGSLHVQAFFDHDGNFREVYLSKGSTGGCNSFMVGLSRMISLTARAGVKLETIVDQLHSTINCPSYIKRAYTSAGGSCPHAIGHALIDLKEQFFGKFTDKIKTEVIPVVQKMNTTNIIHTKTPSLSGSYNCPDCGTNLMIQEGCVSCNHCGYTKC